jgi:hypothetical protein
MRIEGGFVDFEGLLFVVETIRAPGRAPQLYFFFSLFFRFFLSFFLALPRYIKEKLPENVIGHMIETT